MSIPTVSQILNIPGGEKRFSKACVQRVREVGQKLRYFPNHHARSLLAGRTETIGAALGRRKSKVDSWVGSQIWEGLQEACWSAGYQLAITCVEDKKTTVPHGLEHLRQRRMDGLALLGYHVWQEHHDLLMDPGLPIVLMEYSHPTLLPVLTMDDTIGLTQGVAHLAELGHREVLWVGPDDSVTQPLSTRCKRFAEATFRAGIHGRSCRVDYQLAFDVEKSGPSTMACVLEERLAKLSPFTAIMCYNDFIAISVRMALSRLGLRVPQDVSLIGFDNSFAALSDPPMTTVDHRFFEMSCRAGEILIEMSKDPSAVQRYRAYRQVIPTELVIRKSTASPPAQPAKIH